MDVAGKDWSVDDDFKPIELSLDSYLSKDSSSCRFLKDSYTGNETKERQHIIIQRKRILRRKGSCKTRGTSRSNTASPNSLINLGKLADDISDGYTNTVSSYSNSTENVAKSKMYYEFLENDKMSLEVLGEGSKLMKSFKLPTVITRIKNSNLRHSMVYYVTLNAEFVDFVGHIPALMFSGHHCSDERTELAELLPLHVNRCEWSDFLSLVPMLRRVRYKRMFRKGCNFKIVAIESIRAVDWSVECPWKVWDLDIKQMQKVVVDVIYEDIRQIPKNMLKALKRLKCQRTFKKSRSLSGEVLRASQMSSKETELSESSRETKLSDYCKDLVFTGLAAQGGSGFAEWFKTIPPNVRLDQNFKCQRGTILGKDTFSDLKSLEKYLRISESI